MHAINIHLRGKHMLAKLLLSLFTRKKIEIEKKRILFIVKKRTLPNYDTCNTGKTVSTGLLTSAGFVVDLVSAFSSAEIVEVNDNNDIDREVTRFKPDIVLIEALWVVPEKISILQKLHPNVQWVVRLHSDTPFLANEGIAFQWLSEYVKIGVKIAVNSSRIKKELSYIFNNTEILYLPNYYNLKSQCPVVHRKKSSTINIGCFGAIRPMKNQLLQAIAAIKFANEHNFRLKFHINSNHLETKGDPVLKNLRNLFAVDKTHQLIEHSWLTHSEFKRVVETMDICMQVSLSETYNIVTADAVSAGIPVVVSKEISWVDERAQANSTSCDDILNCLEFVYKGMKKNQYLVNFKNLQSLNSISEKQWKKLLM
jgi:hypothetical protein